MIKWLTIPESTKRNAYNQIAEKRGMSPFAVEKDWWVMQTLTAIFEMEIGRHLKKYFFSRRVSPATT